MSTRNQVLLVVGLMVMVTSIALIAVNYSAQREAFLKAVDDKLLVAAHLAGEIPGGPAYFDRLEDRDSIPPEEYSALVERNNRACLALGLQYLWSCMVVDGRIVFTTSTSPGHDLRTQEHAGFFEAHRDPASFRQVFNTMQTDLSSFHNEWGSGRMALVPRLDSRGRPYCLGASVSTAWIQERLRQTLLRSATMGGILLVIGLGAGLFLADSISRPLIRLTQAADDIARGEPGDSLPETGSLEMRSLARSVATMSRAIQQNYAALRREIQERTSAQAELQQHRDRLEELVQARTTALERSNRDLEQYAAMASHDLQQPLRAAGGFARILSMRLKEKLDPENRDLLERILKAVTRMQQLVGNLLAWSRAASAPWQARPTDCEEVLAGVLDDLRPMLEEASARITHDPLPTIPADPDHLAGLLGNLLGNAVKFRGQASPHVHIRAEEHESEWLFSIQDNGIGIAPEFQERIFKPFERLHSRKRFAGSGLGLALCRRMVERAGGRIWVESEEGKGAVFRFTLPRQGPEQETSSESTEALPASETNH